MAIATLKLRRWGHRKMDDWGLIGCKPCRYDMVRDVDILPLAQELNKRGFDVTMRICGGDWIVTIAEIRTDMGAIESSKDLIRAFLLAMKEALEE